MRNKTQERIEELARERAATTIDLALVEDGIEIGKKMMAEKDDLNLLRGPLIGQRSSLQVAHDRAANVQR